MILNNIYVSPYHGVVGEFDGRKFSICFYKYCEAYLFCMKMDIMELPSRRDILYDN